MIDKNTKEKIRKLKAQNASLRELCDEVGDIVATYINAKYEPSDVKLAKDELKRFDAWLDNEFKKIGEHYV